MEHRRERQEWIRDGTDAVLQGEADAVGGEGGTHTDLIILTHEAREGAMNAALAQLQGLPSVLAPIVRIRKEELN